MPPQAGQHAEVAELQEGRDRARVARRRPGACAAAHGRVLSSHLHGTAQAMLLRESLGISADGSEKAFSTADIQKMIVKKDENQGE